MILRHEERSLLPTYIKVAWLFLVGVDTLAIIVIVELVDLDQARKTFVLELLIVFHLWL